MTLSEDYFKELKKESFDVFMMEYSLAIHQHVTMLAKAITKIDQGNDPSKNHLFNMRMKTLELEKFGKQFRERTLKMEKSKEKL